MHFPSKIVPLLDETIQLEEIVYEANRIFLQEQIQYDGDATTCCVSPDKVFSDILGSISRDIMLYFKIYQILF